MDRLSVVFDIDGTICPIKNEGEEYEDLIPNSAILEQMKAYKKMGTKIVLFTSRNMNSYGGNIGLINVHTAKVLLAWLDKWEIPYDEIVYGKPWPGHYGFYVDDRAVRPDEFLRYDAETLLNIYKLSRVRNEME